jgi:hypothetical protein
VTLGYLRKIKRTDFHTNFKIILAASFSPERRKVPWFKKKNISTMKFKMMFEL